MEVHAHTHTERKKWTHYLWEFLMLFLAVSAGFFVENMREHYVEGKRTKVLSASLITDLQKDTALLNFLETKRLARRKSLDSFNILLHKPVKEIDQASFYGLLRKIYSIYTFSQARGTIDQLRNAGYLRYFSDSRLLQHISDYEFLIQDYKADENIGMKWYDKFIEYTVNNLNQDAIDSAMQNKKYPRGTGIPELSLAVLKSLVANIVIQRANNSIMKTQNEDLKKKGVEIMDYLHSTYHLK